MKFWDNESIERFLNNYNSIYLEITPNNVDGQKHTPLIMLCKQVAFTLIVSGTVEMQIRPEFDRCRNVKFDDLILTPKYVEPQ